MVLADIYNMIELYVKHTDKLPVCVYVYADILWKTGNMKINIRVATIYEGEKRQKF